MASLNPSLISRLDPRSRRAGRAAAVEVGDVRAVATAGGRVRVEVSGRLGESRLPAGDAPVLVVDDGHHSHRFAAEAVPDAGGGRFLAVFSIPAGLGARLVSPLVMFVGGVAVPLPDASLEPALGEPSPGDPVSLAERRARRAEVSEEDQTRRAVRAETEATALRAELAALREHAAAPEHDPEHERELSQRISAYERKARAAAQHAHAERRRREEAVTEAAEQARRLATEMDTLRMQAREADVRARTLEHALERSRRAEAEARQAADAAAAARASAERRAAQRGEEVERTIADALVKRSALERRAQGLDEALGGLRTQVDEQRRSGEEAVATLSAELDRLREQHRDNVGVLHRQVRVLNAELEHAGAAFRTQLDAERRARRVLEAELAQRRAIATPIGDPVPPGPDGWLADGLRRLAREDPEAGARLALELLRAQAPAGPGYDLDLRPLGWFRVTAAGADFEVTKLDAPRPRQEAPLRLRADPSGVVALLVRGGRAGRRHGVRGGRRPRARRLRRALAPVALEPAALAQAGVRPEPLLVLRALATRVGPDWTRGHAFSVAHEVSGAGLCYVSVRDGEGLQVSAQKPADVVATVRSSPGAWERTLAGRPARPGEKASVRGNTMAAAILSGWLARARGER